MNTSGCIVSKNKSVDDYPLVLRTLEERPKNNVFMLRGGMKHAFLSTNGIRNICFALVLFYIPMIVLADENEFGQEFTIDVRPQHYAKTNFLIACIANDESLDQCVQALQSDITYSGQFEVLAERYSQIPSRFQFQSLAQSGYQLALFIAHDAGNKSIDLRLYNTKTQTMLIGKRYYKQTKEPRVWAHAIGSVIWPVLTGQQAAFFSRIAYCKRIDGTRRRPINYIYVADIDGSHEQRLVGTPTAKFAPRWNKDKGTPLLFYSECCRSNTRLAYVSMNGKRSIASNFDGINMLLSFAEDGRRAAYCSSQGSGSCQLFYCAQGDFRQITHNDGNNISPTFSTDGTKIYFCSDYHRHNPAICSYEIATGSIQEVITDGYCVSPAYCPFGDKLAFAKMVHGTLQLFMYDIKNSKSEQLTFDGGDKEECSWSPCGNYLVYSVSKANKSRIAMLNVISKKQHWITSACDDCSYPTWSPIYNVFPLVSPA